MSYMRGKFYVWSDGERTYICHGRDMTEESNEHDALTIRKHLTEEGASEDDILYAIEQMTSGDVDPEELRTGVTTPVETWLPNHVFDAIVVRRYERMTAAEKSAASGDTQWEVWANRHTVKETG